VYEVADPRRDVLVDELLQDGADNGKAGDIAVAHQQLIEEVDLRAEVGERAEIIRPVEVVGGEPVTADIHRQRRVRIARLRDATSDAVPIDALFALGAI